MVPSNEELVSTCASLIEVPSTDDNPEGLREVVGRVRAFFEGTPVNVTETVHGGYPSIVVTTRKTHSPACLLHGHVDVVAGAAAQFRPKVSGDRLCGRGAVDMKGFVGVAMHVVRDLSQLPDPPDVGLMINTDEEIGGRHGAKALVEAGWRPKMLINGDGGYGNAVTYAQKGIVQLDVEAETNPGARNTPWHGEGAAEVLIRQVAEGLSRLCPQQANLHENDNWGSTACVLSVRSEPNGIGPPRRASASIRVYWAGEQSGSEVIEMARDAFHPLNVSGLVDGERVYLPPDDQHLQTLRAIWQRRLGRPIGLRADNGSSDAKWFVGLGIPILILRTPGDGAHTENEWLEVSALGPLYETLREFVSLDGAVKMPDRMLRADPAQPVPPLAAKRPVRVSDTIESRME